MELKRCTSTEHLWNRKLVSLTCVLRYLPTEITQELASWCVKYAQCLNGDRFKSVTAIIIIIIIIRPHSSDIKMRPFATDGIAWSVCVSVCRSRSWTLQKTAEPIDMWVWRRLQIGLLRYLYLLTLKYSKCVELDVKSCSVTWLGRRDGLGVWAAVLCPVSNLILKTFSAGLYPKPP